MADQKPIEIYCSIPLYLRRIDKRTMWLQWQRYEICYGFLVTNLDEAIAKAHLMIDATLELEIMQKNSRQHQAELPKSSASSGQPDRHPYEPLVMPAGQPHSSISSLL